ncbi:MAG: hypothetical protein R3301_09540 [Saprospiraceae bacterium]|nr:hypothetical protein [Saprospiraceae bacterium]
MTVDRQHMVGPLFGFFRFIRNKSHAPLSIDQYDAFVRAVYAMDLQDIQTAADLMELTKIFWLSDTRFQTQYEGYFRAFFQWEELFANGDDPDRVPPPDPENGDSEEPVVKPDPADGGIEGPQDPNGSDENGSGSIESETVDQSQLVDFELLIRESQQGLEEEVPVSGMYAHDFNLSLQSLMPFNARKVSQRLRRKVETAEQVPSDRLDLREMSRRYATDGFLAEIIYEMADASHSNVVLLADRFGSMYAHSYLEEHLRTCFRQIPHCTFEHYYFYNVPDYDAEKAHYCLTVPGKAVQTFYTSKHKWTDRTWIFILSDAGAHSGMVNRPRMHATLQFWHDLRAITPHVYWINPVPFEYLNDCTAKRLQLRIPMYHPDEASLNQLITASKSVK